MRDIEEIPAKRPIGNKVSISMLLRMGRMSKESRKQNRLWMNLPMIYRGRFISGNTARVCIQTQIPPKDSMTPAIRNRKSGLPMPESAKQPFDSSRRPVIII